MEIKGRVIQLLTLQQGQGQKGPWFKQEFIIETEGQYPKKICLAAWNANVDKFNLSVGDNVHAFIDIESREHNGRWYTEIRVWKLEKNGFSQPAPRAQAPAQQNTPAPSVPPASSQTDDLPF